MKISNRWLHWLVLADPFFDLILIAIKLEKIYANTHSHFSIFLPIVEGGQRLQLLIKTIALTLVTLDISLSLEENNYSQLKDISLSDTPTCKTSDITESHTSSKFECSVTPPPPWPVKHDDPFCYNTIR